MYKLPTSKDPLSNDMPYILCVFS